jgi:hypothetical protein
MADNFKVAKDAQGNVVGCGPNHDGYEPAIPPGGSLEFSDVYVQPFVPQAVQDLMAKRLAVKTEAEGDTFIDNLRNATPNQIKTFVQNNVTDLASARQFISKLAIAVAYTLQGGGTK